LNGEAAVPIEILLILEALAKDEAALIILARGSASRSSTPHVKRQQVFNRFQSTDDWPGRRTPNEISESTIQADSLIAVRAEAAKICRDAQRWKTAAEIVTTNTISL